MSDFIRSNAMDDLGGQKVVVLMEVAPNTDRFAQVMLTREEFKSMTAGLWARLPLSPRGDEVRIITTRSTEFSDVRLPEIRTIYTQEEKEDEEF